MKDTSIDEIFDNVFGTAPNESEAKELLFTMFKKQKVAMMQEA